MRPQATISVFLAAAAVLAACAAQPRVATEAELNYEGLQSVASRRFAESQVRPGVDFTHYRSVQILEPDLEFRTPDRTRQEFPLDAGQKERLRDLLSASFRNEFSAGEVLALVGHPGPDVLTLNVRIIDITARVPQGGTAPGSRGSIALDATGQVTLVLEVSDSESGQILARGVETRRVRGAAMRRDADMITRWDDVESLADRWAESARTGLEALVSYDDG